MGTLKDISGENFGRLTAVEFVGLSKNRKALWSCECDCGERVTVLSASLLNGRSESCGCLKSEKISGGASKPDRSWKRGLITTKSGVRIRMLPPQSELLDRLKYNPNTGELIWKKLLPRSSARPGDNAGFPGQSGYLHCWIKPYGRFPAHRVIWKMMTGDDPSELIDHIDGDRGNNRWHNLREASPSQNVRNSKVQSNSNTGIKGVSVSNAKNKRYTAKITIGTFDTAEEAHAAYRAAANLFFGEFASTRTLRGDNGNQRGSDAATRNCEHKKRVN